MSCQDVLNSVPGRVLLASQRVIPTTTNATQSRSFLLYFQGVQQYHYIYSIYIYIPLSSTTYIQWNTYLVLLLAASKLQPQQFENQRASWRLLNGGPLVEPPVGSVELLASTSSALARRTTFCRALVYKAGLAIVIAFQTSLGSRAGSNKDPKILATVLHTCEDFQERPSQPPNPLTQVSTSISIFSYQYYHQGGNISSCIQRPEVECLFEKRLAQQDCQTEYRLCTILFQYLYIFGCSMFTPYFSYIIYTTLSMLIVDNNT